MEILKFIRSEEFKKYAEKHPIKPVFIPYDYNIKTMNENEKQELLKLCDKLKETVKKIQ